MGYANLEASRSDTKQVETRVENMTEMFRASNSQTASRIESRIQSSTASLGTSIKDEIHRAMSSIPRETNISRASLETLSTLVAQTVASQFESLASEDSLERLSRHSCFGRESNQRMANNTSQTETVEYITAETQVTVDECSEEQPGDLHREVASSRLTSRTSVQKMTTFLGTMLIRRSTINSTFSSSSPELITERTKAEIDFLPAHWLWSWTGCGMFLARMGLGKPRFDFSFDVARVLDFKSDPEAIRTLSAVRSGDLDALKRYFQSKTAYPTDRDESGTSLLAVSGIIYLGVPWYAEYYAVYSSMYVKSRKLAYFRLLFLRLRPIVGSLIPASCFYSKVLALISTRLQVGESELHFDHLSTSKSSLTLQPVIHSMMRFLLEI